mgnify:FL=1
MLQGDKLLFYPYEAMNPFLDLVHEAAYDPECISLRITLYRVAKQSRLCESLIDAAENGKEVTVLMELRARFDEQNNIEWAERLEEAGCTVIYGSEALNATQRSASSPIARAWRSLDSRFWAPVTLTRRRPSSTATLCS